MPVGNELNHTFNGLTIEGGLAIRGATSSTYLSSTTDGNVLINGQPSASQSDYYLNGQQMTRESIPRASGRMTSIAIGATGVMYSTPVVCYAGDIISKICFVSGGTAAVSPTAWWFAIYDTSTTPALLMQTADQGSTAWGTNTAKDLSLTSPVTIPATGAYYVSLAMAAATIPTMFGTDSGGALLGAVITGMKVLGQTSGSGLTATAPPTIATPTTTANRAYVLLH